MPRKPSAGERRKQRAELQQKENERAAAFGRKPRDFTILPPLGSAEPSPEADCAFSQTIVLNERTAAAVLEFREKKLRSRKHRPFGVESTKTRRTHK